MENHVGSHLSAYTFFPVRSSKHGGTSSDLNSSTGAASGPS
jgi:hypothetical protein